MKNRILDLLREGRLVRGTYVTTDEQGRQLLCLLTALTGDPNTRPDTCPASVAPPWVAYLALWWDDSGTLARWLDLMRQIGELAPRFGELSGETGRRALAGCQLATLRVALRHADKTRPVVERLISLWERVLHGDEPTADEWKAERAAAARASEWAEAADAAAAWTAWEATWAASRAAEAAKVAVTWAALAAPQRRRGLLWASEWAEAAEAAESTADEIIQGHIDAIRNALGTAGGGET